MAKDRVKMSPARRAKQFVPFAAVTGLEEALDMKRREFSEKYTSCTDGETDERTEERYE